MPSVFFFFVVQNNIVMAANNKGSGDIEADEEVTSTLTSETSLWRLLAWFSSGKTEFKITLNSKFSACREWRVFATMTNKSRAQNAPFQRIHDLIIHFKSMTDVTT